MTVRLLQIGVGIRGGHWAQFVKDYPDATCVAFVDSDPAALEKAKAIAGDGGARLYTELDAALKEIEADAALVVSPSVHHAEHTRRALEAGLTVMVEKPMATSVAEAADVLRASRETGRQVIVAENYRYWPSERTVRKVVADGVLGRIDSATLVDRRLMPSATEGPWLATTDYPQLQEVAIHHFDSLRYFFDQTPDSMTVRAWNPPWSDYKHGANTEALIDLGGIRVQYLGTMLSHRYGFALWIEGEDGVLWTNRKYVFLRPAKSRFFRPVKRVKVPPGDEARYPKGGTTSLLNSLRDAVLHGRAAETRAEDNIWNVGMVEAGKISDREGRSVALGEVMPDDLAPRAG